LRALLDCKDSEANIESKDVRRKRKNIMKNRKCKNPLKSVKKLKLSSKNNEDIPNEKNLWFC
jgi:hypothetical protein